MVFFPHLELARRLALDQLGSKGLDPMEACYCNVLLTSSIEYISVLSRYIRYKVHVVFDFHALCTVYIRYPVHLVFDFCYYWTFGSIYIQQCVCECVNIYYDPCIYHIYIIPNRHGMCLKILWHLRWYWGLPNKNIQKKHLYSKYIRNINQPIQNHFDWSGSIPPIQQGLNITSSRGFQMLQLGTWRLRRCKVGARFLRGGVTHVLLYNGALQPCVVGVGSKKKQWSCTTHEKWTEKRMVVKNMFIKYHKILVEYSGLVYHHICRYIYIYNHINPSSKLQDLRFSFGFIFHLSNARKLLNMSICLCKTWTNLWGLGKSTSLPWKEGHGKTGLGFDKLLGTWWFFTKSFTNPFWTNMHKYALFSLKLEKHVPPTKKGAKIKQQIFETTTFCCKKKWSKFDLQNPWLSMAFACHP